METKLFKIVKWNNEGGFPEDYSTQLSKDVAKSQIKELIALHPEELWDIDYDKDQSEIRSYSAHAADGYEDLYY